MIVIERLKYDSQKKDRKYDSLADEPEMKELKRMIQNGELDPDRAAEYLKKLKQEKEP